LYGFGDTVGFALKTGEKRMKNELLVKIQNLYFGIFDVLYASKVGFFNESK